MVLLLTLFQTYLIGSAIPLALGLELGLGLLDVFVPLVRNSADLTFPT